MALGWRCRVCGHVETFPDGCSVDDVSGTVSTCSDCGFTVRIDDDPSVGVSG